MMDIMTYFVLPVLGSVFMLGAIFYSMNQIGTNREHRANQQRLSFLSSRAVVVCVYILLTIVVSFLGSGVLNLIVMFLIPLIGHYYYNSERQYIIFYVLFVVVIYLVDALSAFGLTYLFSSGVLYFANEHLTIIGVIFTIRFVEFSILRILTGIIRRMKHGVISKKQMLSYFILPAFSIVNLFSLMYLMDIFVTEDRFALLIINIGLLICINLYFTSVFDTISRNNRLKNELNLHHQQQAIQVRYYEALEQKYDTSRSLVHDIRNHIQSMQQLYEMEKQPEVCQYTRDIHEMLNRLGQNYYTSNKMLNIILNDKVQTMRAQGISEDIKVADVDLSFIRNVDMTTLFSNILDNAIEAASVSDEKKIHLRVSHVHDFITITLKNTSAEKPLKKDDGFLTTKPHHEGLGLKNVKRVVEAYKGDVQFEWRDAHFITRVMLTG